MKAAFDLAGAPDRRRFFAALALSALAGVSGIVLLGLSGWFLTAAALAGASGAGYVFNHLYPSAGVRAAAFSRVLARYTEQLVGHDATLALSAKLRPALFAAEARALRGLAPMPAGALASLIDDVETVEAGFLRVVSPLAAVLAAICVALGFAAAADMLAAAVAAGLIAIGGWILPRRAVGRARAAAEALASESDARRRAAAHLVENAVELDVIGALPSQCSALSLDLDAFEETAAAVERPFRGLGAVNAVLGGAVAFLILALNGADPAGVALAAGAALSMLAAFDTLSAMAKVLDAAPRAAAAARRLSARLDAKEAVPSPPLSDAARLNGVLPITAAALVTRPAPGGPQIGPLDFEIAAGCIAQVLGPSGAGKTTLLETLLRLHETEADALRYAGIEGAACRPAGVLAHMAIAPQFPSFPAGTLREQFRLADPAIDDDAIWRALETAGLADVVRCAQGGLETLISDEAEGFSGGELRRLGLARALAADPQVLVLDEPFAGLEPALAQSIAKRLAQWAAADRAIIVARHEDPGLDWGPLRMLTIDLSPGRETNER